MANYDYNTIDPYRITNMEPYKITTCINNIDIGDLELRIEALENKMGAYVEDSYYKEMYRG